jgi:hypothetical protein
VTVAPKQFPSSEVRITRVYLVDCDACGERVDDSNAGHGEDTREAAEETKAGHVAWHRASERL